MEREGRWNEMNFEQTDDDDDEDDVPSEDPSEISSRYVRASEPPLSRGGSAEEEAELILLCILQAFHPTHSE